ncbi:MAG: hypothetical protein JRG70_13530, partial [Deltaproteobacteria bacterium]|nr:hypothetical protein [Deltaproteobacteria bacterium]
PAPRSELALRDVGATPGELVRALRVDCRDESLAAELVESKRDSLPWCENLKPRADGSLDADWHKGPLSVEERNLLKQQQAGDLAAKRERRDRVIREMQREPL